MRNQFELTFKKSAKCMWLFVSVCGSSFIITIISLTHHYSLGGTIYFSQNMKHLIIK